MARVEIEFADINCILNEHTRQIEQLTISFRDRIGFKG